MHTDFRIAIFDSDLISIFIVYTSDTPRDDVCDERPVCRTITTTISIIIITLGDGDSKVSRALRPSPSDPICLFSRQRQCYSSAGKPYTAAAVFVCWPDVGFCTVSWPYISAADFRSKDTPRKQNKKTDRKASRTDKEGENRVRLYDTDKSLENPSRCGTGKRYRNVLYTFWQKVS